MRTYTKTVKLGPLTGLEIASYFPFFLLRMNFHLLPNLLPSKYFSPLCQLVAASNYSSIHQVGPVFFIPAAPCLTLRHHFPHPGSWQSLPRLAPRWSSSSLSSVRLAWVEGVRRRRSERGVTNILLSPSPFLLQVMVSRRDSGGGEPAGNHGSAGNIQPAGGGRRTLSFHRQWSRPHPRQLRAEGLVSGCFFPAR